MIILWVFGNAVCAKVGNSFYPLVYLLMGLAAAAAHMKFSDAPAIGASGAINGIVGMFVVFYPLNYVKCFFGIFFRPGIFTVSSIWIILLWLAFDILGAMPGSGGIAYYAHLGGFFAGAGLALACLKMGWVKMDRYERSLLQVLAEGWHQKRRPSRL